MRDSVFYEISSNMNDLGGSVERFGDIAICALFPTHEKANLSKEWLDSRDDFKDDYCNSQVEDCELVINIK